MYFMAKSLAKNPKYPTWLSYLAQKIRKRLNSSNPQLKSVSIHARSVNQVFSGLHRNFQKLLLGVVSVSSFNKYHNSG